jgi:hypothetical protein
LPKHCERLREELDGTIELAESERCSWAQST